jgi:hypothetical protein
MSLTILTRKAARDVARALNRFAEGVQPGPHVTGVCEERKD